MAAPHPSDAGRPEGRPAVLRVAFGSVPKDGGTFTFYRTLRPVLRRHGIDLRCVSVGRDQAALTDPAFVDDGCVQLAPRMSGLKDQARAFAEWSARERIDIIFGVNSPAILSAIPHLPEEVRVLARCANGFDEGYRLTLIGQERLARIVALVPRLRDDLVESYGVDPDLIALIPNGASPDRFAAAAARPRGEGERLELGVLGRLEHGQKGVLHLPRVLTALERAAVPFRLTIAGRGRDEGRLRQELAPWLARDQVRFAGPLAPGDIPAFLGGIDAFLFPSHFEGCPNALLEAMMAGAVPVAWQLPGITDFLIADEATGFLVEKGDAAQFAERLARLSRSRDRLRAMSASVAADARARFSETVCADAYVSLLAQVMAEPAPDWVPRPWSRFRADPMFRQHPLSRIVPPRGRAALRTVAGRLLPRIPPRPPGRPSGARGPTVHHVINSCDMSLGGAERMVLRLHAGLLEDGVPSRLVSLQPFGDGDPPRGAVSLGLTSPYDPRALSGLAAYARTVASGDVVHGHLFPTSAYLAILARGRRLSVPLVFTEHSTSNRRRGHALGGYVDAGVYGAFDRIVAISGGVRDALVRAQPSVAGRTVVIPNGCPLSADAPLRRDAGPHPPTVLSVGRLTPAKNYPAALRAIARLRSRDARYVIAGDGPEREGLRAAASRLGIADRVEFAGHVADIRPLMRDADVFLMPSLWEGFGLAAVEAMDAGLPVVASDVPGLREVVGTDGACALLVDPSDADGIAAALDRLLGDPEARHALGAAGRGRARLFGFDSCLRAHVELYRSLAEHRSHAAQ